MYSRWHKYIYNKIKMKNLPILLVFYWLTVQIYSIAMLFDGIPSIPSPSHIYNIMEKSDMKLENQITSKLETFLLNDTKGVSASDSHHQKQKQQQQLSNRQGAVVKGESEKANLQIVAAKEREESKGSAETLDLVPNDESNGTLSTDGEGDELKDEIVDSVPMEPTPLADSDFVTEDPSQVLIALEDGETNEVEAAAETIEEEAVNEEKQQVNATTAEEHPIPVFSEWAKQMEKAEKEQEQDVANASTDKNKTSDRPRTSSTKIRAKNYASPDCGAKIIASNQESDNTGHVLSASKDEYLISICTSRIWFVVELCEPIQAEKVELANFELFSSSPKEFSVSVSNRYPTRDWSNVGQFVAKDERTIQNFDLDPKLFGKFVRVDIHSHYNKEHFCPVSLFRVQGTSEFEAFETADLKVPLDDYDDEDGEAEGGGKKDAAKEDNNLFKSASDAVLSIVKKAASVLTKGEDKTGAEGGTCAGVKKGVLRSGCVSLSHVVVCERCQENVANEVAELLTCKHNQVEGLWQWPLVQEIVYRTDVCSELMGVQLKRSDEEMKSNQRDLRRDFVAKLFPESHLIAICNVAAVRENRLPRVSNNVNDQDQEQQQQLGEIVVNNLTIDQPGLMEQIPKRVEVPFKNEQKLVFDPMRVVTEGEKKVEGVPVDDGKAPDKVEKVEEMNGNNKVDVPSTPEPSEVATQVDRPPETQQQQQQEEGQRSKEEEPPKEVQPPQAVDPWRNGDTGLELNSDSGNLVQKVHGESVFLRLSNRIKALERNMSLSSQYLEELSRRYKKQVEELQQSFAKTILSFEETSKQTVEEKQQLVDENMRLRKDIESVLENFIAWKSILFYLCVFVAIQIVLFVLLLLLYVKNRLRDRRREKWRDEEAKQLQYLENRRMSVTVDAKGNRRNSTEGISGSSRNSTTVLADGKRRPSEEALQIVGTYSELLIESPKEMQNVPVTGGSAGNIGGKKKNKSGRNRKTSLPNQVFQEGSKKRGDSNNTPTTAGTSGHRLLMHSNSVNGYPGGTSRENREEADDEFVPPPTDTILLEENDEFYLPGSDLSYVEFVTEGGGEGGELNSAASSTSVAADAKKASRRLSSPAFLKTALQKSVRRGGGKKRGEVLQNALDEEDVQSTTSNSSWDWLRRGSSSSTSQAKSEQLANGGASFVGARNGSVSLSSQDSAAEGGEGESSPKKTTTTKFRKIFRKVF